MPAILQNIGHRLSDIVIRGFIGAMHLLPYDTRLHVAGLAMAHVVVPLSGGRRRIRNNLALVLPELPASEIRRLQCAVPYNMGRTVMELYSAREFSDRVRQIPLSGPGLAALDEAHAQGRGVMLVTGHIGNYDAVRAALLARGFRVGGLYKRMSNPYFNAHYVAAISQIGEPLFERGRRGMAAMVKFLRKGGMVGLVLDQRMNDAPVLDFMGKPARTALSATEMALRYDALVLPCYGIRQPGGGFEVVLEPPVPHSTPEEMTQTLNDSLAAQVRAHPEQWMWTHNRWKNAGNATPDDRN